MNDEQKHDHWSELADQVGADPLHAGGKQDDRSEGSRADGDVEAAEASDRVEVEIAPRKVRSYRPKKGWEELAQEFDLPATAWSGEEAFDALFDETISAGDPVAGPARAETEVDFDEAVAAASQEIKSERSAEEKQGRRRKKQRRQFDKIDLSKDDALGRADDSSQREQEAAERKRDKRHRKGRSRRKKDSQQTVAEESLHEAEDILHEPAADAQKRRDSQQDRDKSREEGGEKRGGGEELRERQKMISHRGIPTWDEAMNYIIAANMEKRSKKDGGGSQSRSKGDRGGGRERANSRKRPG